MAGAVDAAAAYVLHQRPYRESSLLLDVFSAEHGRVGLVARGRRRPGRRGGGGALNLFQPWLLSWRGRGDLGTLTAAEPAGTRWLTGSAALLGLYANEVLTRVLHRDDPHPQLFDAYVALLEALAGAGGGRASGEVALRRFELALLDDIGYGLYPGVTWQDGAPVRADGLYRFVAGQGMEALEPAVGVTEPGAEEQVFRGADLLALAAGDLSEPAVRRTAKRLLRRALAPYLGPKPLASRHLFRRRS